MPKNPYDLFHEAMGTSSGQPTEPPAPAPEYNVPQPPATRQEAIQPMKNYELLTRPERGLFEQILPGVRGSWAGSAMNWVANNPIASKVLPWLDILAEGVERTSGLMNQMEYYRDDPEGAMRLFQNLSETWKASSLNYNLADLPQLILGDIQEEGLLKGSNIRGIRLPDDMPGVEGLNRAREMLIAGATMEEVEAVFEEEMGALWMRGQMYDMYGHIFLDPINYLMPYLAPIGKSAFASRIHKVTRIANLSDDVIAKTTKLLRDAEKAGNMAKVHKYKEILKGQEGLTTWEKISDLLGGGRELLPDEALKAPTDASLLRRGAADVEFAARKGIKIPEAIPIIGGKRIAAPHTLTPASRGVELATMVHDAVHTHIFQPGQTIFEKLEGLHKFADGAISGMYGHYFLAPEGRLVQGFTKGIAAIGDFRFKQYDDLLKSGIVDDLGVMAKTLDTTVDDIATTLVHGKGVDELAETLGRNVDELTEIGRKLEGSPWSEELWQMAVKNDTLDLVEQASVAMYGIQTRGKIQAWSGALKSAETLAWLKMNPSFPIKNYFTDELIMVAQGVTGKMSSELIENYWKVMGFDNLPQRLKQGIGMAGLEGGEVGVRALSPIAEATMGKPGWLAKFSRKVNEINLGPFDMAAIAQKIESKHSAQAFTVWHQKAMKQYWKAGVGFDPIENIVSLRTMELMEAAEPGLARKFNNWASSQTGKKGLDDFLDANYNISIDEILDEARIALGYDVDLKQVLPEEYLINLKVGLPEAAAKGKIPQYIGKFKRDLQTHLDELAVDLTQRTAERAATQAKIEGPQSWYKMYVAVMDDLQSNHVAQAVETAKINDVLRGANKAAAGQYWAKRLPEAEQTFGRIWDRTSAMLKGIRQGTDGKLPRRVVELFDGRVSGWKKFYKVRNGDYKKFFDARAAGKEPPMPWDTMKAKHNMMYLEEIEKEANLLDEMAEIVASRLEDPAQQKLFRNINGTLRESRLTDKQSVIQYQEDLINAPSAAARQKVHDEFWPNRYQSETHTYEQAGEAAMQGNAEAAEVFAREAAPLGKAAEEVPAAVWPDEVVKAGEEYGEAWKATQGWRSQKVAKSQRADWQTKLDELESVEEAATKHLDELIEKHELDITARDVYLAPQRAARAQREVAEAAIRAQAEAAAPVGKPKTYLPDINQFWPEEQPIALAQDQYWFNRGFLYIDAVEQAALAQAAKKPLKIAEILPKEAIDEVTSWIGQTKAKYGDINNAAVRMGEYGRDAALLNYSRRYNYNTWLGTVAPYEFWMTQSMMKWALHSIDHPAMLSTYWRYQKMLETVGAPNQQIPSRLRDHFEVELPFLPDWMGNSIFVDPLRMLLPFKQYSYPFEEWNRRIRSKEGRAEYMINQWAEDGTITQLQADEALEQQGGDLWRRAINEVEGESSELRTGPFDFATIFASPHAPIMWAYHAMNDETEKISPIMPLTRYSKAAQGLLGPGIAGDIAGVPHQIEAKVRTTLGLPAFDAWDDYRVERMMTNLAGEGKYPYEEVMRQWIAKEGPIWDEAVMLSDKEFGVSGLASAIGLSLKAYPPGEKEQRRLQTELRNAFEMKEANPDAEVDPVWQFYQEHPEYSARQALWDEPEERMRKFMFDLLYDKWNNMSTVHQKQVKEVIGDDINSVLYPDDAESGKVIKEEMPIGILQNWLMTMGGDVPGEKEGFAMPVEFIDPVIANRAQVYYDSMNYLHPEFWDTSSEYYENPENLRKEWGRKNPEKYAIMKAGWDFKRDWLWRNPDVAPYITDKESWYREFTSLQEREDVMAQTPDFRPEELIATMPQEAQRLVYDYVYNGDDIPEPVEEMLEEIAQQLGISLEELLNMLVDNR